MDHLILSTALHVQQDANNAIIPLSKKAVQNVLPATLLNNINQVELLNAPSVTFDAANVQALQIKIASNHANLSKMELNASVLSISNIIQHLTFANHLLMYRQYQNKIFKILA